MSTTTPASDDRLPTVGPDPRSYERYEYARTDDGDGRISELHETAAWIQSSWTVSLDAWR